MPIFNQQLDMNTNRIKFGNRAETTAEYLAEFLGVPYEELAAQTAENAARLYQIAPTG